MNIEQNITLDRSNNKCPNRDTIHNWESVSYSSGWWLKASESNTIVFLSTVDDDDNKGNNNEVVIVAM